MSVLVLSSAFTTDESKWRGLRETAAKHGVPLHIQGVGEYLPELAVGFRRQADFLEARTETHIVVTDAFDVLVSRWDEFEVMRLIDSAPHLIMSVEQFVWPMGPWAAAYERLGNRYPWMAICGGQYCGRREQMIEVFREIATRWERGDAKAGGTSQEILHQMFAEGYPFTLDLECRIFQSMLGEHAAKVKYQTFRALNVFHGSSPMFLHWNGCSGVIPQEWREAVV